MLPIAHTLFFLCVFLSTAAGYHACHGTFFHTIQEYRFILVINLVFRLFIVAIAGIIFFPSFLLILFSILSAEKALVSIFPYTFNPYSAASFCPISLRWHLRSSDQLHISYQISININAIIVFLILVSSFFTHCFCH